MSDEQNFVDHPNIEISTLNRCNFWDLYLVSTLYEQLLTMFEHLLRLWHEGQLEPILIGTPNPEQLMLTRKDPNFRYLLGELDFLLPDGVGLILASRLLGWRWGLPVLQERLPGVQVVSDILDIIIRLNSSEELSLISSRESDNFSSVSTYPVLVIGGRDLGRGPSTDWNLTVPGLELLKNVKTNHHDFVNSNSWFWIEGYEDVLHPTDAEERHVLEALGAVRPAMVLVALGAPHQEKWLVEHRQALKDSGVGMAMAVGGALDMLTGKLRRAPSFMQRLGLEWLFRLVQEPWRWKRQRALVAFSGLVLKQLLIKPIDSDKKN